MVDASLAPVGRRGCLHRRLRGGDPRRRGRCSSTVARAVDLEPVRSSSRSCADLTRDIGATQVSTRALDPRRVSVDVGHGHGARRRARACTGRAPATGDPVLLITGLGLSGGAWWRTVPVLSRRAARDHVRQPRRRTLERAQPRLHDRGDGRRRRRRSSTTSASSACTSTASRSAAWSPSSSRCAIPSACARSCSARRTPGGPRAVRADDEVMAFFRAACDDARGGGRLGVGPLQLRPALPQRARRPHRGGHRAAARAPVRASARTARSCSRRACTTATAACDASPPRRSSCTAATTASSRSPTRSCSPSASRARACRSSRTSGHLYPTEEPEVDEAIGAFFAEAGEAQAVSRPDGARRRAARRRRRSARQAAERRRRRSRSGTARGRSPTRELDERSNRLAQALLAAGVGPGTRVAHLDRTAPEVVELLFAASKIGAVARAAQLAAGGCPSSPRIVADAGAPLLIAGSAFADAASAIAGALPAPLRTVEVGTGLRAVGRRPRPGRPGRSRRLGRHRRADVHVGHHRRPEGRPHHAPQPRGRRRDVAALGLRRRHGQPHAAADVPHRRHRLGVPRAVERRDHDPGQRVRRPRPCSTCSSASA